MSDRRDSRSPIDAYAVDVDAYGDRGGAGVATSSGRALLARHLADRRRFVRTMVIGEALGERRRWVLGLRPPAGKPETE
jgi:hypothetical protein